MMPKIFNFLTKCSCCAVKAHPVHISVRGLPRYNKSGGMTASKKRRLPLNWRVLNYNPARIPSAWKPEDWDERQQIDYERECELAKYIPGYQPKTPNHLKSDFNTTPLYTVDNSTKLVEGLKQAMYLTKSVICGKGLPNKISDIAEAVSLPDQDDKAIQVFRHAHLFDIDPRNLVKEGLTNIYKENLNIFPKEDRICSLIMQEMVRLCEVRSHQVSENFYNRMLLENIGSTVCFERECTLLEEVDIPSWQNKWLLSMRSAADMQVQSRSPFPLFTNQQEIEATTLVPLSSVYPTMPVVDIKKTNNYTLENLTGIPSQFSRPHLHTMVTYNYPKVEPNQLYAKMLCQLFAALYARAVSIYGNEPQDLPEPIAAQCVGSDGRLFQFLCLQLNTTKMQTDDGIKNMVWVDNENVKDELYNVDDSMTPFAMYSECSHLTWRSPTYYTDYNPDVFKTLQGFWLNGVV